MTLEAADARPLTGSWVLYDPLGRTVQAGQLPGLVRARLPLAAVPPGSYLLRIADAPTLRLEKQ